MCWQRSTLELLPILGLAQTLQSLTFGDSFNQSLQGLTLPLTLQSLTFGYEFNQSLQEVCLPGSLQSLTFGNQFNQSLRGLHLPNLQSLTFGHRFNQSLQGLSLPNLQCLTFLGCYLLGSSSYFLVGHVGGSVFFICFSSFFQLWLPPVKRKATHFGGPISKMIHPCAFQQCSARNYLAWKTSGAKSAEQASGHLAKSRKGSQFSLGQFLFFGQCTMAKVW